MHILSLYSIYSDCFVYKAQTTTSKLHFNVTLLPSPENVQAFNEIFKACVEGEVI